MHLALKINIELRRYCELKNDNSIDAVIEYIYPLVRKYVHFLKSFADLRDGCDKDQYIIKCTMYGFIKQLHASKTQLGEIDSTILELFQCIIIFTLQIVKESTFRECLLIQGENTDCLIEKMTSFVETKLKKFILPLMQGINSIKNPCFQMPLHSTSLLNFDNDLNSISHTQNVSDAKLLMFFDLTVIKLKPYFKDIHGYRKMVYLRKVYSSFKKGDKTTSLDSIVEDIREMFNIYFFYQLTSMPVSYNAYPLARQEHHSIFSWITFKKIDAKLSDHINLLDRPFKKYFNEKTGDVDSILMHRIKTHLNLK